MTDKLIQRALNLDEQRPPRLRSNVYGPDIWTRMVPNRFAFPFPTISQGPIRSTKVRREKGIRGY